MRLLSTDHEVACHFAEEVEGSKEQAQATGSAETAVGGEPAASGGGHTGGSSA